MAKILIVDDVYSELQLMQNALAPLGHEIITSLNGADGEKKVYDEKPDIVVLDVILPDKNGFQICRDIKNNDSTKNIPVILVSSKDQDSDKFWGKKQGADEYLTKPFRPQELVTLVSKYLS
ncbi:MAG: response regulator [Acidobacteria bacterium]|jgi:DNA-binding response OmpR family regulator|nr:response regulator [Acidobacteriota bacterium]